MKDTNCPYCNAEIDIDHDDGEGFEEGVGHEQECPECEQTFVYYTSISFSYSTHKADCLNDGVCDYELSNTHPKFLTEMQCKNCGGKRKLTEQEKIENNIPLSWNDEFRKKD